MKVYNSYTRELEEFEPINDKKVKMYVCGPTVYDHPHLGHARCYITWDMVYRYLKFRGYDVTYCRNVTDVDDKIINKAVKEGTTTDAIAQKYYDIFKASMEKLKVESPDIEPKATDNIDEMINIIKILIDKGFAYAVNGDVYFRVKKFDKYGLLNKQPLKDLEAGARVEMSDIKEDVLDFALWKKDEEHGWESPWGKGRPGWHIECSAMSKRFLGETIDIHAGGADLLFPHHENEIAQSECASGKQFVKYWLHNGFVTINKEKMSKSLGNFVTIDDMLQKYDSNTIRFFILTNHYRMPVEFGEQGLNAAKAGTKKLRNAVEDVFGFLGSREVKDIQGSEEEQNFIEAMDDDFNTSRALAVLFETANKAQKAKDDGDKSEALKFISILLKLSDVLGFNLKTTVHYISASVTAKFGVGDVAVTTTREERIIKDLKQTIEAINDVIDQKDLAVLDKIEDELTIEDLKQAIDAIRSVARIQKNWALSDKIRDNLVHKGITIKDSRDGSIWNFDEYKG